ncbi:hypothetical protein INT46_009917 [Mucor plumbeus]|uniref:SAP domain-containing protein n=1 Tax=Mucor plumbeus TaxID=97098 RepID=A0A8H7QRI2_9FUNG|nr:hypothetical protein INT46_009917 [Mucor plumbeus]
MFNRFIIQRRTLHCSRNLYEEWTKASLRRMKKNDLVHLAKENHLNISGTKNDIIIQLLSHQTAKIVGSTTPSLHSIRKVVEKTDDAFEDVVSADNEWMNAFEMKVAQRGSRKPMSGSRDHFTPTNGTSKPHPFNDGAKTTIVKPAIKQATPIVPPSSAVASTLDKPVVTKEVNQQQQKQATELLEELEGMDPAWVEAFDLKVGSRGARHQLTDTLSPSIPSVSISLDELPFINVDKSEHHPSTAAVATIIKNLKSETGEKYHEKAAPVKETLSSNDNSNEDQTKNTWINTIVGTSMLGWYIFGEKGLANIWHYLTASSSSS